MQPWGSDYLRCQLGYPSWFYLKISQVYLFCRMRAQSEEIMAIGSLLMQSYGHLLYLFADISANSEFHEWQHKRSWFILKSKLIFVLEDI